MALERLLEGRSSSHKARGGFGEHRRGLRGLRLWLAEEPLQGPALLQVGVDQLAAGGLLLDGEIPEVLDVVVGAPRQELRYLGPAVAVLLPAVRG